MKLGKRALCAASLVGLYTASMLAQTPPAQTPADPQTPPASTPAPAPTWSVGPINFSGLIDGYYSFNFQHPASRTNVLRNFDVRANQFSLNMAKMTLSHDVDPVGFTLDLGFGRAFDVIHFNEKDLGVMRNILQAYASVKPFKKYGMQIDVGKFVTSAGAELTETHLNWNYSRALIYANGPYYHFGARVTLPVNSHFTAGVQVVNGWNNVEDNNSGKTIGLTSALTFKKVSWFQTYYVGPEKTNTNEGYRNFYDTVLLLTPNDKANFYINYDYGVEKYKAAKSSTWATIGAAARFQLTPKVAFSPRVEYYNDIDGFITGKVQKLKEVTLTGEYKMAEGFLTRLEYRRDWSDQPFYDRGNEAGSSKNMDTLLLGVVVFFGPKR